MQNPVYPLEFLFDGRCPLCLNDVAWLRRHDEAGRLIFIDAAAEDFDATVYGVEQADLLARIHGRLADGRLVQGPEVFRLVLAAVGYGWLVAPTRWPGLRQATELAYALFARHRPRLARLLGGWPGRRSPGCSSSTCQG